MVRRFTITFFSLILFFNSSNSQEVQRANIKYTPSDNGYELNIPFAWKFINCYGEVNVTITKNNKDITSNAYIYNGVRYTSSVLGNDAFVKPKCALTDISADVYHNGYKLGNVEMGNVTDWFGGCFGQTYHVTKLLGLIDTEYNDKVSELSLSNLKIINQSSRDYSLESNIKEIEKRESLKEKIREAENAYAKGNLEEAKKLYEEVLKIEYSSEHANSRIAEIKAKLISQEKQEEFNTHLKNAEKLEEKGDYEGAKSAYQKALGIKIDDGTAHNKLRELEEKLNEEKNARRNKSEAFSAAANRNHSGSMWGKNHDSDSYGTATQAANLIGYFRLDYNIWTIAGEPAHKFRFYWEWANSLNTGYPQWVSVLHDEIVMIKELEKYPDLLKRWNNIKPEYIEVECEILSYKSGNKYVADKGRIKVVPEVIGYSGQEVDWSLPSSSNWNELFPYCNGMEWGYFRKLGLYEEINEYEGTFGNDIAWPKYAFEYSDNINYFQSHSYFHSDVLKKWIDTDDYSSSVDIVKVVWPVEEIDSVIKEFEKREKQKKEEKMSIEEFWNIPESEKKSENSDFWNTPENDMTHSEKKNIDAFNTKMKEINLSRERLNWGRKKYSALIEPLIISSPSSSEYPNYTLKGKLENIFENKTIRVSFMEKDYFSSVNKNGEFSFELRLITGVNNMSISLLDTKESQIELKKIEKQVNFISELDGEGMVKSRNVKITVEDHNSVQDDYYQLYVNDKYIDDVFNSPGGSTTINTVLEPGDNFIELKLYKKKGKDTGLQIIINDGEFKQEFSGSKNHKYIISAPYN